MRFLKQVSGFALPEVVIAATIFALGAMVVTGFYMTASGRGLLGRNVTAGALLAQQRIEAAQAMAYSNLSTMAGTETIDQFGQSSASGPYTRVTTVTKPAPGITPPSDNLTQIQVTVSWSESYGQKSFTMYTLKVAP